MPILGAHMSIAGGYYKAVVRGSEVGCECVQIFTKNNNQWRAKPLTDDDAKRFQDALAEHNISHPISHSSYLINLASPKEELWNKSVDAFVIELQRAEHLGVPYVVLHPGAHTTATEQEGLQNVIRALDEVHDRVPKVASQCLLEITAGQGTCLGWRFEHLAEIINGTKQPDRVGVCFDTCHAFAAGYPLQTEEEYQQTFASFDKLIGLAKLKAFHLNDSRKEFGSRVDRHDHIGEGALGLEPFRHLLNDARFSQTPMYLETAKDDHDGEPWDVINLRTLRNLVSS